MISTNIDGTSGGGQLLDFLSLIAGSPEVYANKLKELQEATAENKKYVELVGPASDIVRMKTDIATDKKVAKEALDNAKTEAASIVAQAKVEAKNTIEAATKEANNITAEAKSLKDEAYKIFSDAKQAMATAQSAKASADSSQNAANAKSEQLKKAISEAKEAKDAIDALKADIIAKHKAFIASL